MDYSKKLFQVSNYRKNRTEEQTLLQYALSDCQEQFNHLKKELDIRHPCERDNLKVYNYIFLINRVSLKFFFYQKVIFSFKFLDGRIVSHFRKRSSSNFTNKIAILQRPRT